MILLAVLAGLYAIGGTGYYKLSMSLIMGHEDTAESAEAYPMVYKIALGAMSLVWPVMTFWALAKEAAK